MDRTEALRILANDQHVVEGGQEFFVSAFTPAYAYGVARLFHAIYGDGYPIDTFYIPERLIEENACGKVRSVVARTGRGDVVSHVALYRSSPPNPHLYEYGLGLTLPAYRSTLAFFRANQQVLELLDHGDIHGLFSEAVCNHMITQKLTVRSIKGQETALEPGLMPASAYATEQSATGRVACMVYARVDHDVRRLLHVPRAYRDELACILDGLSLDRELLTEAPEIPPGEGAVEVKRFDFAGVARCTVTASGEGLAARLAEIERSLREDDYALIQCFIDLGQPWSGGVVEQLRRAGYCLGGLLPIWFGSDGLLMQKYLVTPDFDGMQIYSERGRTIQALVRRDWERRVAEGTVSPEALPTQ